MTVQVTVYHKTEDRFWDYEPGQPLTAVVVLTEPAGDPLRTCDRVYELLNAGDDPTFGEPGPRAIEYRARRNRSLSIGDVIGISDPGADTPTQFWACANEAGWTRVEDVTAYVTDVTTYGTTPLDAGEPV